MNEYERVIYSFFDMFGDIGGFVEACYLLCIGLVSGYANRMFFASVIQDIFKVRLETHGRRIKELVEAKSKARERRKSAFLKLLPTEEFKSSKMQLDSHESSNEEEDVEADTQQRK